MRLSDTQLEALRRSAAEAALKAGKIIQAYAGKAKEVRHKNSGSTPASKVVSEADLRSQEIILKYLEPSIRKYDLGLLTEESDDDGSRLKKDYFWCVDPLDGTLPFLECRPGYAVSVALVSKAGDALIGVVFDPLTETLYEAVKDHGVLRNRTRWKPDPDPVSELNIIDFGGAVMNACKVLDEAPAVFSKTPKSEQGGGCIWDYAATSCLFAESGAWVSDYSGKPLNLNSNTTLFMNHCGVLFASSPEIAHEHVKNRTI